MQLPHPSLDHFTRARLMRLVQVLLIFVITLLLILTRRDLGIVQAELEKQNKSTGINRAHERNTTHSHASSERPKDWKSLLARLKNKSGSLSEILGIDAELKARIIFLQMSPEELVASLLEIQKLDLPAETKIALNVIAGKIFETHYKDTMLVDLWGKCIDFDNQVDLVNAFKEWLRKDSQAATAWYDQYGKANPLSPEEMDRVEWALILPLIDSDQNGLRRRLENLPPEQRFSIFVDTVIHAFNSGMAWNHNALTEDFLTMTNELEFSPKELNRIKKTIVNQRNYARGESQVTLEGLKDLLDLLQLDPKLYRESVQSYHFGQTHDFLRETYSEEIEQKLLQTAVKAYEWAESLAPGSGRLSMQNVVDGFFSNVAPSDEIFERAVKLQSLIPEADITKPLIDSLMEQSMFEEAKALKARLNQWENLRGEVK